MAERLGANLLGKAWRCKDGVVRWVYGQTPSTRNLHIRWLSEEDGRWHAGGMRHPKTWPSSIDAPVSEHPAPQPGELYIVIGPLGSPSVYRRGLDGVGVAGVRDKYVGHASDPAVMEEVRRG